MLPLIGDIEEALDFVRKTPAISDPQRAYVIAFLSRQGWTNRQIRQQLDIDKVYTLTHFKRVGMALSDIEFDLWEKNPERITLGHLRALCHMKSEVREPLLRLLVAHRLSVTKLQQRIQAQSHHSNADIKRFENNMEDKLGRGVKIQFDPSRQSGKLTLDFFGLDDLDHLAAALGFSTAED